MNVHKLCIYTIKSGSYFSITYSLILHKQSMYIIKYF